MNLRTSVILLLIGLGVGQGAEAQSLPVRANSISDSLSPVPAAPAAVQAKRLGGHALMHCTVTVTGQLKDCRIISEDPPGSGLGTATLKIVHLFRVKPATRDGQPVEATINIPLTWKLSDNRPANAAKVVQTPPASELKAPANPAEPPL